MDKATELIDKERAEKAIKSLMCAIDDLIEAVKTAIDIIAKAIKNSNKNTFDVLKSVSKNHCIVSKRRKWLPYLARSNC